MKKKYEKPSVIFEEFLLNEGIAACEMPVTFGPEDDVKVCGDYGFGGDVAPFSLNDKKEPFYEATCQCYYTAPKESGYFGKS